MNNISDFCIENNIHQSFSGDSYYFSINGTNYRVSNHTIERSNQKAYDEFGNKIREKYHDGEENYVCIFASKTRIIQIYTDLKNGKKLDKRGYEV